MSYRDDDRRDYYREQDRRAEYNRDETRRYENFVDDMKYERERSERDTNDGIEAIRNGNLAWGAHKLGLTDFAIEYLRSQSSPSEMQSGSDIQVNTLNQLAALGAAEQPDVMQILRDPSMSAHDRVFMAGMQMIAKLDSEVLDEMQKDINSTSDMRENVRLGYLRDKRNELMATLKQLMDEQNERVRSILNSRGVDS